MAAIIRDSFKVRTLQKFIESLSTNSLYLGIGRPYSWDTSADTDTDVPVPLNINRSISEDWTDIISLKKYSQSDAYQGIIKETWKPNVIYDIYRHDWGDKDPNSGGIINLAKYTGSNIADTEPQSLGDVKCYVITDTFDIYICMKQGIDSNGDVKPSTYSPEDVSAIEVGTNMDLYKYPDGYYWKFVAVTSTVDAIKFSTKFYHPVETLTTQPSGGSSYIRQWNAQLNAATHAGGIYTINIKNKGTGYNNSIAGTRLVTDAENDAEFKILGDGNGLQYTVTYGAGGSIDDIEITDAGQGYTYTTFVATGGINFDWDVIYTPMTGLGADPVVDLVARYLLLDVSLVGDEGGVFTITNDYRKLCLIFNPFNFGTNVAATLPVLDATLTLTLQAGLQVADYPVDAVVTGGTSGCTGRVLDFDTATGLLRILRTPLPNDEGILYANNSFVTGETLTSVPGNNIGILQSAPTSPQVAKYTGDVLYSEYKAPISRGILQTEYIKIVLKF